MKSSSLLLSLTVAAAMLSCQNRSSQQAPEFKVKDQSLSLEVQKLQAPPKTEKDIPVNTYSENNADSAAVSEPPKASTNNDWDKKIIKTATLKLEVKDFAAGNIAAHKIAKQFGGYIAQEEQNFTNEKSETILSIKVPVDKFDDLLNQLPVADAKIIERKITTEDVTAEVVDTKSRLEAKKQMRLKYLEFLKQSKNMEEVLQVQNEINSIQEEIESASGRIQYLSHQALYSTVNLTLYQPLSGYQADNTTPSFLSRIGKSFKNGAVWIADIFVGLVNIWPLLLVMVTGIFLYKRAKRTKSLSQKL